MDVDVDDVDVVVVEGRVMVMNTDGWPLNRVVPSNTLDSNADNGELTSVASSCRVSLSLVCETWGVSYRLSACHGDEMRNEQVYKKRFHFRQQESEKECLNSIQSNRLVYVFRSQS